MWKDDQLADMTRIDGGSLDIVARFERSTLSKNLNLKRGGNSGL